MGLPLDSLDIRITAESKQAVNAITALQAALSSLNSAMGMSNMDHFLTGLANISRTANGFDVGKIKDVANSLELISKASDKVANVGLSARSFDIVSHKAENAAKSLAKFYENNDKRTIERLTPAIERMYRSVGNDEELRRASQDFYDLARSILTVKTEAGAAQAELLQMLRAAKIPLPKDWAQNINIPSILGSPLNFINHAGNKTTKVMPGMSTQSAIEEQLPFLDMSGVSNDYQALQVYADNLASAMFKVQHSTVSFDSALERGMVTAEGLNNVLAQVGLSIDSIKARSGSDNFLIPPQTDDELASVATTAPVAAEGMQKMASAVNTMDANDPFAPVVAGLQQLSGVSLSDSLKNLTFIKDTIQKIGGESGANAGRSMEGIARGLQALNVDLPAFSGEQLSGLAAGLRALGSGTIVTASQTLPYVAQGLRELASVPVPANAESYAQLAHAISRFGLKNIEKSIVNLPALTQALNSMITTLASAPAVNENTIRLVEAISKINPASMRAAAGINRMSRPLRNFHTHAGRARKQALSLASAIGRLYAKYWLLYRIFSRFGQAMKLASDLTETQNIVDVTFGEMSDQMDNFAKTAVDTLGMSELTAKQIGSRFQAMGQAMHIPKSAIESTNEFLQAATKMSDGSGKAYANVADSMADVSINLTRLAGDMASFYNQEYADVAKDLEAVFTGMTRPLRKYGLDLTQATLKEFALANGMNADIKSMTNAEKTMLRYQYVMANTTAAQGDFIRTQDTWANQTKIAKERLKELGIVLGKIGIYTFKPLVQDFNKAMNEIIHLAESTLNALGKIFGWQVEISDVGILADEGEDFAESMEDAAGSAKKIKDYTLGIDELNIFSPDNNGSGGGGDIAANMDAFEDAGINIKKIDTGFESLIDTLFDLGARIGEVELDFLKGIDWDKIKRKMRDFAKGLAEFLNGYLSNVELFYEKGRFLAEAINTLAEAMDAFFKEFDGRQLGIDLGTMVNGFTYNLDWDIIKSAAYEFAHDIAETINGFVETADWYMVGKTIIEGLNTAILFASTIVNEVDFKAIGKALGTALTGAIQNFDVHEAARLVKGAIQAVFDFASNLLENTDFNTLGEKIGTFLRELRLSDYIDDLARLLADVIGAALKLSVNMLKEAPFETALIAVFAGWKLVNAANTLGSNLGISLANAFQNTSVARFASMWAPNGIIAANLGTDIGTFAQSQSWQAGLGMVGTAIAGGVAAAIGGYNFALGFETAFAGLTNDQELLDACQNLGVRYAQLFSDGFLPGMDQIKDGLKAMWDDGAFNFLPFGGNIFQKGAFIIDKAEDLFGVDDLDKAIGSQIATLWEGDNQRNLLGFDATAVTKTWNEVIGEIKSGLISLNEADLSALQENLIASGMDAGDAISRVQLLREAQAEYFGEVNQMLEDNRARHQANTDGVVSANNEIIASNGLLRYSDEVLHDGRQDIVTQSGELVLQYGKLKSVIGETTLSADDAYRAYIKEAGAVDSLTSSTLLLGSATEAVSKGFNGMPSNLEKYVNSMGEAAGMTVEAKDAYEEFQQQLTNYQIQQIDISSLENINQTLSAINEQSSVIQALKTDTEEIGSIIEGLLGTIDESLGVLVNETIPADTEAFELAFTDCFGNIETALKTSITNSETALTGFNTWFDANMLPRTTKEYWDGLTGEIAPAFERAFKNAANIVVGIFNNMIDAINDAMDIEWDEVKVNDEVVVEAGSAQLVNIPHIKGYYTGGFPQNGDLFFANERGAELIGSINGKTAVSSNEEITGIRDAVYESSDRQAALMEQFIVAVDRLSQIVEDKELSIGDEQIAEANLRGANRLGMAIIS